MTRADFSIISQGLFTGAAYKLFWSGFTWSQAIGIAATQAAVDSVARPILKDVESYFVREGIILALQVGAVFGLNQLLQGGLLPTVMTTERLAWIIFTTPICIKMITLGIVALGVVALAGAAASQRDSRYHDARY